LVSGLGLNLFTNKDDIDRVGLLHCTIKDKPMTSGDSNTYQIVNSTNK